MLCIYYHFVLLYVILSLLYNFYKFIVPSHSCMYYLFLTSEDGCFKRGSLCIHTMYLFLAPRLPRIQISHIPFLMRDPIETHLSSISPAGSNQPIRCRDPSSHVNPGHGRGPFLALTILATGTETRHTHLHSAGRRGGNTCKFL